MKLNVLLVLIVALFCWMLLRMAAPISSFGIGKNISLCNIFDVSSWNNITGKPSSMTASVTDIGIDDHFGIFYTKPNASIAFECKTSISANTLYYAKTLNVLMNVNQAANMQVGLKDELGRGVNWDTKLSPNKTPLLLTFTLERKDSPKINWLHTDYSAIAFYVFGIDTNKPLEVKVYKIFLQ